MMSNDDSRNLNPDQLLLLADAFEKLARCYAEEAKQKSLRNPLEIAEDMIQKAIKSGNVEGYRHAIRLFDDIKSAFEAALLK